MMFTKNKECPHCFEMKRFKGELCGECQEKAALVKLKIEDGASAELINDLKDKFNSCFPVKMQEPTVIWNRGANELDAEWDDTIDD